MSQQQLRYVGKPQPGMLKPLKRVPVSSRLNGIVDPSNLVNRTWIDSVDGISSEQQ